MVLIGQSHESYTVVVTRGERESRKTANQNTRRRSLGGKRYAYFEYNFYVRNQGVMMVEMIRFCA